MGRKDWVGCGKRRFTSVDAARRAHAKAGYRIRTYWCSECRAYHVTAADKRERREFRRGE
jgi:hypothetical protein